MNAVLTAIPRLSPYTVLFVNPGNIIIYLFLGSGVPALLGGWNQETGGHRWTSCFWRSL